MVPGLLDGLERIQDRFAEAIRTPRPRSSLSQAAE
jgi:hypothetical protein